ncbi:MAG: GGDEF domain-containing protein [Polyangiaceae bacterium]
MDRTLGLIACTLTFRIVNLLAALRGNELPLMQEHVDLPQLDLYIKMLEGTVATWAVMLGVGIVLRKRRTSEPYTLFTIAFFWLTNVLYGSAVGLLTNTFWVTFLGAAVMMLLLFGPRRTYIGMAPGMLLLAASVLAERLGYIRYAPIFATQPFDERGHPLLAWYLLNGSLSFVISVLLIALAHVIFERWKEYDAKLELLSATDHLTGVANRRSFRDRATAELSRARRRKAWVSVILLDVDFFKKVNDTYGHTAGDQVLIAVAGTLRNEVREHDLVARYGGEEFVILLSDTDLGGAVIVAERLREQVAAARVETEGAMVSVTVTLGVASCPPETLTTLDDLIREADLALYDGKANGRNRVITTEMRTSGRISTSSPSPFSKRNCV